VNGYREGKVIYRATVTDTISRERLGRFAFSLPERNPPRKRSLFWLRR